MYLKMSYIMKKNILLSFCLLGLCSVSACSSSSNEAQALEEYVVIEEEQQPVIDATVNPNDRCGVDGIGCNDSALINYTKTEADYRAYGERTKRDHLYTQAAAGNNLTATIPPAIEDDVVTEYEPVDEYDDDVFSQTAMNDIDTPQNGIDPSLVGRSHITGPGYEIICSDNCDEFGEYDEATASEFTEDSFDIDQYIKKNGDNIEFTEIGEKNEEVELAEVEITDDTILTWDAKEGDTLKELLTSWCAKSGWKLLWNTNRNYTLTAGAMFKGKFADVSSALIRAFARARPAPIATYYKGNRVIVVETMENENAY